MFAFYKLAESSNTRMEYGVTLKFVKLALICNGKQLPNNIQMTKYLYLIMSILVDMFTCIL